jgi:hypothetical protein
LRANYSASCVVTMGRAIASPEVKAAKVAAKLVAKALAKAIADSTPEAIAKAEAKRVAKMIAVAKAAVVAEAKAAADAVEREIRAQIAKEGIVKWPITEDQCMTFALFNTLDRVGKELFTCGGSMDPRDVVLSVMGRVGRTLLYGVNSHDVLKVLWRVVENDLARGKDVKFVWKRTGFNVKSGLGWDVNSLQKTVLNKPGKKFVILGKTRWQSDRHKKWMQHLAKVTEAQALKEWGKEALGTAAIDHAIGIRVEKSRDETMIVDNGCTYGMKKYTAQHLVDRMEDLCVCYEFDLYEV